MLLDACQDIVTNDESQDGEHESHIAVFKVWRGNVWAHGFEDDRYYIAIYLDVISLEVQVGLRLEIPHKVDSLRTETEDRTK